MCGLFSEIDVKTKQKGLMTEGKTKPDDREDQKKMVFPSDDRNLTFAEFKLKTKFSQIQISFDGSACVVYRPSSKKKRRGIDRFADF